MAGLFTFEGVEISGETILNGLSKLSLHGKDLYIAMDLAAVVSIAPQVKGRDDLSFALLILFQQAVSDTKSIILPAFTFSWGGGGSGLFSRKDRTHLGVLPNYLIEQDDVYRSADPMFSCVVRGGSQSHYVSTYDDSFGEDSLFQRLHRKQNASIMNFGTRLFNPSFIHYVEQYVDEHISPLGYRTKMKFEGEFEDEAGNRVQGHFYSLMRSAEKIYGYDYELLEQEMRAKGVLEMVQIGGATVQLTDAVSLFDHLLERMTINPRYYLRS